MKIHVGNLWTAEADFIGITTNGTITKAGNAVMGRGVALQAKQMFPGIEKELGTMLTNYGNVCHWLRSGSMFSFPVKHNWWEKADINLIALSVKTLVVRGESSPYKKFAIPLPGTGNGKLKPEQVWPLMKKLPNNVTVVIPNDSMLPVAL